MNSKLQMREIRSSDISDINEVVSFHNAAHGDSRIAAQWTWEYLGNYPDLSVFAVIEDDGVIVGTNGRIPIYLNIKGKRYLSGKSENSLLHPKYRGGTLFQDLYEFATSLSKAKKMHCIWGYTGAVTVWRNKLGLSVYDNCMYESILILNVQNALSEVVKPGDWAMVRKISLSLLATFCYSYSLAVRFSFEFLRKSLRTKYSIEHCLRSIDDLNALYERLRGEYPGLIHIDQDEQYIRWRIFNNPNIKYETYFLYEDSLLRGYCYVGANDNTTASLTDFTFESAEVGAFLLRILLDKWRHEKIGYVYFLGNAKNPLITTIFNLLKGFGFLRRRSSDSFVLKNISYKDEDHLYDIKNWYAGGLWTEGYTL